ncbi:MATE family efflux transporter [Haloplanus halophilus]|uniref:MATE family efflux transporter n=1 Tax=Haloplanus halophilus TaxID=2949993 RepID=UPI00203DC122|nr:MATE family efflux transporter [Haloplanus sp. GDY1]
MNLRDLFKSREEFDLTDGDVGWPLLYLSLPIVVTNLLQTAYNLADTFWIGQYSTDALAAISFAFPMVFLIISLGMGLAVAGSILVAQYTGAGEEREAEYAASQTVGFAGVASLLLGAVAYVFVGDVLALLGPAPDVLRLATGYMEIISLGIFFMFGFFVFISLMRGYGDTITPMLVMLGSVALNVVLDPILIFGWGPFPQWGIEGAAIATVFSRGLALVVGLWIMLTGRRGVRIRLRNVVPDLGYGRRLVRIGVPASVEGTGQAVAINLLMFIVGTFSTPVVAAFGIGVRVFSVIFLPAIAVSRGVETMSGQNIGAGKPDRAALTARVAARTTFVVLAVAGVITFLFADPIVALFTDDDAVIEVGATFLRYVAPSFGFIGIMRSYNGGFRGAGRTLTAAAIAVTMLGGVRLPIAWVASRFMGPPGIWVSFLISNVVGAVIAYVWFRRGTWRSGDARGPAVEFVDDPADD